VTQGNGVTFPVNFLVNPPGTTGGCGSSVANQQTVQNMAQVQNQNVLLLGVEASSGQARPANVSGGTTLNESPN
jgi:hypothetical protein